MKGDDARLEAHGGPRGHEALAKLGHDFWELIGTDMRSCVDQDVRRRTVGHQSMEDFAYRSALVGPRVQLAIAVGTGAALAEAVVGLRIDDSLLVERRDVAPARLRGLAPIEDDRADAVLREPERAEKTGRTRPHDDHGASSLADRPEPRSRDGGL